MRYSSWFLPQGIQSKEQSMKSKELPSQLHMLRQKVARLHYMVQNQHAKHLTICLRTSIRESVSKSIRELMLRNCFMYTWQRKPPEFIKEMAKTATLSWMATSTLHFRRPYEGGHHVLRSDVLEIRNACKCSKYLRWINLISSIILISTLWWTTLFL